MKRNIRITTIALLLCLTGQLFAQHEKEIKNSEVEGLYLTLSDFKNGKLTRPTDMQHKGDKIRLKQFFISPEIIGIEQGKETVYEKDSIFAVHLSNGENYRFINRKPFLIADTSSLYIYTLKTIKTEYKVSGPHTRSKSVPVTYYYFSFDNHKTLYLLTLENLRKFVLTSPILHFSVCNKFTSNAMLVTLNNQTNHFELNETILSVLKE
ncbi:MAG: hypothetical protein U0W24_00690 [Bacteroidales bacterium]